MRCCLAAAIALGVASAPGSACAQAGVTVFTPAPAQGGVAVPVAPGGPGIPPRDRGRPVAKGTASLRGRITGDAS